MLVALKIDLPSLAAIREALPPLLELLEAYGLKASFFPALGPDPAAGDGLLDRLMRGRPVIAGQAAEVLRDLPERGHEVGAVPWDVAAWRARVLERDAAWTREQMLGGLRAWERLYGQSPRAMAAPGFLINADTPVIESALALDYAVDTRGLVPYLPMGPQGPGTCPQIPVTLPRIEDMMATGEALDDLHQSLFMESQKPLLPGHVFSYTTGDPDHLGVLEKLIVMWMGSQRELVTLGALFDKVDRDALPYHHVGLVRRDEGVAYQAVQGERVANE